MCILGYYLPPHYITMYRYQAHHAFSVQQCVFSSMFFNCASCVQACVCSCIRSAYVPSRSNMHECTNDDMCVACSHTGKFRLGMHHMCCVCKCVCACGLCVLYVMPLCTHVDTANRLHASYSHVCMSICTTATCA